MNRPLGSAAVPAGIAMLCAAAFHALLPFVLDLPFGLFTLMLASDAALAVIAILLLFRKRHAGFAVLFFIAAALSVMPVSSWFDFSDDLPFFVCSGVRVFVCLGMTLVCLRRAHEPKRGAWGLLLVPMILEVAILGVCAVRSFMVDMRDILTSIEFVTESSPAELYSYATVAELLLMVAVTLTAIAFSRTTQQGAPASAPEWTPDAPQNAPAQQSQRQSVQQNPSAEFQEAVVEILDD